MKTTHRVPSACFLALLLLCLCLPFSAGPAGAEDGPAEPLSVRIFHVGGLTAGKLGFIGEHPPPVGPRSKGFEDHPLFGRELEEPVYPVGQVDELIELMQGQVDPVSWEIVDGAQLRSQGENAIVARNHPRVLAEIARWLARLEQRVFRTALVEVRARRGSVESSPDEEGPSLSFMALINQRVSGFTGSQYAYVSDYDVSVATGSTISDPTVNVANLGLGVDATVIPGGSAAHLMVDVDIRLSRLAEARPVVTGEHRSLEAPAFEVTRAKALVGVVPGRWTAVAGASGGGGWAFDLRVTLSEATLPASSAGAYALAADPSKATQGSPTFESFDLFDLFTCSRLSWLDRVYLTPSKYTPPEPNELPEPTSPFYAGALIQFILHVSPAGVWGDPMTMEVRNGRLLARNTPAVLRGIGALLTQIRREVHRSATTRLEVIEMPASLLAGLQSGAGGAFVLTAAQREGLEAALLQGAARRVGQLRLPGQTGVRKTLSAGQHVSYVQDYDVEIAEAAQIGNPVVRRFFTGLQLGVTVRRTSGDGAVVMEVDATRSREASPMRQAETPVGTIELPHLQIFRIHTGLLVPLGASVLLAAEGDGDVRRVLLLTPTLIRGR